MLNILQDMYNYTSYLDVNETQKNSNAIFFGRKSENITIFYSRLKKKEGRKRKYEKQ